MDSGNCKRASIALGRYSDTSGAIRSDDDFSSIGYSYEDPEQDRIDAPPRATDDTSCSRADQESDLIVFVAGSPGGQTLAAFSTLSPNRRGRFTQPAPAQGAMRNVTRSCEIMKETYFKNME